MESCFKESNIVMEENEILSQLCYRTLRLSTTNEMVTDPIFLCNVLKEFIWSKAVQTTIINLANSLIPLLLVVCIT